MRLLTVVHEFKVSVNPRQDLLCLAFSKVIHEPIEWFSVAFAAIAGLARREHVGRDRTRTIGTTQRNEVIGVQFHTSEQPGLTSAISTTSVPPIKTVLPLLRSELSGQRLLAGLVSMPCSFLLCMSNVIQSTNRIVATVILSLLFTVCFVPARRAIDFLGAIRLVILSIVFTSICCWLFVMRPFLFGAGFTPVAKPVFCRSLPAKSGQGQIKIAFGAVLEGIRDIQHSVSLSLSHKMLSASGVSAAVSGATLADFHIIPQMGN